MQLNIIVCFVLYDYQRYRSLAAKVALPPWL